MGRAEDSHPTRVLIVIPTLNEVEHIEQVVTGLLGEPERSLTQSVVVVDGGSTDGTRELLDGMLRRWPALTWIHNPERIQSAGVNLAVRRFGAEADVLVRCDAHAEYPRHFCRRLVETLERTGADSVVVPLDSRGKDGVERAIGLVSNSVIGTGGSQHRAGRRSGFVDHGHHAAFRVASFRAAGGYDTSFTHNEDAELDCRQRALGSRIYLDADIRVVYRPRRSLAQVYRQYFRYGAGRSRTVRRHPRSLRLRQLAVPGHLLACAASPVLGVSALWPFALWPVLYLLALGGFAARLAWKERAPSALLALPVALTMHTAWALGFYSGLFRHRERVWSRQMAVPLALRTATGDGT
jgi:succinoglycan biosynthesis protein ExoA